MNEHRQGYTAELMKAQNDPNYLGNTDDHGHTVAQYRKEMTAQEKKLMELEYGWRNDFIDEEYDGVNNVKPIMLF